MEVREDGGEVRREAGERVEGGLVEGWWGGGGRDGLVEEGEEVRPAVGGEEVGGELGDGVGELFGDGFGERRGGGGGEEEGPEGGLRGGGHGGVGEGLGGWGD